MKNFLLICSLTLSLPILSQQQVVSLRTEQNNNRTTSLYADNRSDADYTIKLTFTLAGYQSSTGNPAVVRVPKGSSMIAKLTPQPSAAMPNWTYSYLYFPGAAFRKIPDTSIAYILPGTEHSMLTIGGVTNMQQMLGQKVTNTNFWTSFLYRLGDTICATRAGTVYETYDGATTGEKINQVISTERNSIHVMHKDGTVSEYSILSPIRLLVSDGQQVIPGQPLAILNKENDKYTMLYAVRYLDEKVLMKNVDLTPGDHYVWLHPAFYTGNPTPVIVEKGKTYLVAYDRELMAKELSKKDRKKLGLQ